MPTKEITTKEIEKILKSLSKRRKLFWSEADFQFEFAWEIQKKYEDAKIRLEKPYCKPNVDNTRIQSYYIDIEVLLGDNLYLIELKYKTKLSEETDVDGQKINLKNQAALDVGRYDFLKDIKRIESLRDGAKNFKRGFAIMLTNDCKYWKIRNKEAKKTIDDNFRIHNGTKFNADSDMSWCLKASKGTTNGRQCQKKLCGSYEMRWNEYGDAEILQHLIVAVEKL